MSVAFSALGMVRGLLRSMAAITRGLRRRCSTAITASGFSSGRKRSHNLVDIETGGPSGEAGTDVAAVRKEGERADRFEDSSAYRIVGVEVISCDEFPDFFNPTRVLGF
jgi:hypothetical protein